VRIPEHTIQEIKSRANIVEVVGEYVRLKKSGENYKGLCPFHTEKTPSFTVSPRKGIFHCFGCGKGGNVFSFIMEMKGLSFPEAVYLLGDRVGVRVDRRAEDTGSPARSLYQVNREAAELFTANLLSPAGREALAYLKGRRFTRQAVQRFSIGYAVNRWDDLLDRLTARGFPADLLEQAGLIVKRKSGTGYYDRFRHRVMFPIQDAIGRCIGFGGRTLEQGEETPKYINTSESPLFHKGRTLYGLFAAEVHIRKKDRVFVTEGYIDVIRMHQAGFPNAVAPLGTALTGEQVDVLLRYTRTIYLLFDPDEAGAKAAEKSVSLLHGKGVETFVIMLPSGTDPGDFFDSYAPQDFQLLVEEARGGVEFMLRRATGGVSPQGKPYSAQDKIRILRTLSGQYGSMGDPVLQEELLAGASALLGLDRALVRREVEKNLRRSPARLSTQGSPVPGKKHRRVETELRLLLLILSDPGLLPVAVSRIDDSYFHGRWTRLLWQVLQRVKDTGQWDASTVFSMLDNREFEAYLSGRLMDEVLSHNPREQLIDLIASLKKVRIQEQLADINEKLREAELENDESLITELTMEKNALKNEEQKITLLRKGKSLI
jgi:DNA primase